MAHLRRFVIRLLWRWEVETELEEVHAWQRELDRVERFQKATKRAQKSRP